MSRRRTSAVVRSDGRLRLRVDLPPAVVELADQLADEAGLDREAVLGDLASVGLPGVLADLADDAVGRTARQRLTAFVGDLVAGALPGALAEAAEGLVSVPVRERSTTYRRSTATIRPERVIARTEGVPVVTAAPRYYSVRDVCAAVGLSPQTLRRLIHQGHVPAVRIGQQLRVPESFFEELPSAVDDGAEAAS